MTIKVRPFYTGTKKGAKGYAKALRSFGRRCNARALSRSKYTRWGIFDTKQERNLTMGAL